MTVDLTSIVHFSTLDRWDAPQASLTEAFSWPVVSLGEIAQIRLGVQVPRKNSTPVGVPRQYLRAVHVRRGSLELSDVRTMHLSETQADDLELQTGDLLFVEGSGSVTEVGRAAIWDDSLPKVVHQNSVVRARVRDERFDPLFLLTWFNSRAGNAYIREQATTTSGLYHIGASKLAGAPVPVPPLEVQRKIVAAYEDTLQRTVEASQSVERLAEAAWNQFTAQVIDTHNKFAAAGLVSIARFTALDRWDTDTAPTGISTTYPLVRLDAVADIRLGTQVPRKGARTEGIETPYLRAANVQRGHLNLSNVKTMRVSQATAERLKLSPRDILFVEGNSREEVGRSAVWNGEVEHMIIQNSIVRARLTNEAVHPDFVSAWFNSDAGGDYIREQATTTSGSLWHIGAGKLAGAPLPIPPLNIQIELVQELREGLASSSAAINQAARLREKAEADLRAALYSVGAG